MKKNLLATLLVAILASSMVFAGFSGNANVALGYNSETGKYGFSNGTGFDFDIDVKTAEAENKGEGNVYAGIKASMAVKVANDKSDDNVWGDQVEDIFTKDGDKAGLGVFFKIAEAYVGGDNWKLIITGTQGAPDFAKSMLATKKDDVKDIFGNKYDTKDVEDSYSVSAKKAPGVTLEIADWKASLGFNGDKNIEKGFDFNAFVQTPVFDFNGVTVQAAAIASREVVKEYKFSGAVGASAKVGFTTEVVSGSVAADYGIAKVNDKYTNGLDAVANLAIDPVTLEVYFKNNDFAAEDNNLLSAKVVTDLNSFDVPVKLTVAGKDLIRKQDLSAEAVFAIDAFEITAKAGYVISGNDANKVSTGAAVAYKADAFTAKAGVDFSTVIGKDNNMVLAANASVESEALIPGAKLALTYGKADGDMNFLDGQTKGQNFGKVEAKCTIAF